MLNKVKNIFKINLKIIRNVFKINNNIIIIE